MHIRMRTHTHTCTHVFVCTSASTWVFMCACMYIDICISFLYSYYNYYDIVVVPAADKTITTTPSTATITIMVFRTVLHTYFFLLQTRGVDKSRLRTQVPTGQHTLSLFFSTDKGERACPLPARGRALVRQSCLYYGKDEAGGQLRKTPDPVLKLK